MSPFEPVPARTAIPGDPMEPDDAASRPWPVRIAILLSAFGLVFVTACSANSAASAPNATATPMSSTGPNGPSGSPRPSIDFASPGPTKVVGAVYSGVLSSDAIEGGCAFLLAADGRRYEVIYPEGWRLQRSPLQLIAPDGSVHSRAGDTVSVVGSEATDMASICQVGPIIRATEVLDR